ncbi:sugar ABC transporter substrate-binding protein [Cryptosporangium sp. NPDC048952]|uniref:sugar ABC transporter substrate-binding protein n=1 Tax=Cryptosporangium sp. NPDC048952 TaxID=3363961 RepID=UPI00371BF08F
MIARRTVALTALALAVTTALTACSQDTSSSGSDKVTTKKASDVVIGYAGPTLTNAFFVGLEKGVKDGAKAQGFKLKETNANGDASQQFNDAMNLLNQGVDVLVLTPIDSNGITPVVEAANQKNVPVFTLDRGASGGKITSFVETDNRKAGTQAATWIADQLKARYGKAAGNVVDLTGLTGTTAAAEREIGFQAGVKANPGLKIVAKQEGGFDQEKSLNAMTNILQAQPSIDAVFGANDDNTVGAVRAIDSAGRYQPPGSKKRILIIGLDGTAQALDDIRAGKQDATISQNPIKMAEQSMGYIKTLIVDGKSVPAHSYWPSIMITKQNIDSAEVKSYGIWSAEVQ